MNTFITHPSVRIKGSENNYIPTQCFDPICMDKSPHMHCPFCVKTECYTDPVILKAHYRVKHVDKGIEFAGLKVLRCCDHCDIVGVIKGEKKFKGAHWHCYKCRNGFNRRDEAIKHYKTHFRNPQTTFQIQIAQEVNQPVLPGEPEDPTSTLPPGELQIHPALTEAITCMVTADDQTFHQANHLALPTRLSSEVSMPVAANETVGVGDSQNTLSDTHTVMIIQEDGAFTALSETYNTQDETAEATSIIDREPDSPEPEQEQQNDLETMVRDLETKNLEQRKEIESLKSLIEEKDNQIAAYQRREQELLNQLSIPLDKGISQLLEQLETAHKDLLHHQLAQLKRTYLNANNVSEPSPQMYLITTNPRSSSNDTTNPNPTISVETINNINENSSNLNETRELRDVVPSAKIHIVKSVADSEQCETEDRDFVLELNSAYEESVDSVSNETLQMDSQSVPVENEGIANTDGGSAAKRRREK